MTALVAPNPRLDMLIAVTWALLAVAEVVLLTQMGDAIHAAVIAWLGGYLSPYVLQQARTAYRKARA